MPRAERERQMLAVAEEVFAERGYAGAAMDEIAERVGVSKPMLYEYFGSKDGLLSACVSRVRTELLDATRRAVAGAPTPEEAMRRGHLAFFRFVDDHAAAWAVLLHESRVTDGPAAAAIDAIREQQTGFIVELLTAQKPDVPRRELEAYAQLLVGASERLAVWRTEHRVSAKRATEYLMNVMWTGLGRLAAI
jgi:AcrR family transcriptional regulator